MMKRLDSPFQLTRRSVVLARYGEDARKLLCFESTSESTPIATTSRSAVLCPVLATEYAGLDSNCRSDSLEVFDVDKMSIGVLMWDRGRMDRELSYAKFGNATGFISEDSVFERRR